MRGEGILLLVRSVHRNYVAISQTVGGICVAGYGYTGSGIRLRHARENGHPDQRRGMESRKDWIPAFAGMTEGVAEPDDL
jgi:hypothetical protein